MQQSLMENRGERLLRDINRLVRQVDVFGFHLATMDFRQHSRRHVDAIDELFRLAKIEPGYAKLAEKEKIPLLETQINSPDRLSLKEASEETVESCLLYTSPSPRDS